MKSVSAVIALVFLGSIGLLAQSAEQEVRRVNEALLAAAKSNDKTTYAKLAADELRWVNLDGSVQNKAQRLAALNGKGPDFHDVDVRVFGDTAIVIGRADFSENGRKWSNRNHRVFIKRNGQWQLVSHAAITITPAAK